MGNTFSSSLQKRWRRLLSQFSETERSRAGLLLVVSIPVIFIVALLALVEMYLREFGDALFLALGAMTALLSTLVLLRTRRTYVAACLFVSIISTVLVISIWTGDITENGVVLAPLFSLVGFFVLPRRTAVLVFGAMAAVVSAGEAARFLGLPWAPALSWPQAVQLYLSLGLATLFALFISATVTDERALATEHTERLGLAVADLKKEVERRKRAEKDLSERVRQLGDARAALLNVLEDTEQERQARKREQERLQTILDELPVGVFVARAPDGTGTMMNKMGAEILGRPLDPSIGAGGYGEAYRIVREDGTPFPDRDLPLSVTLRTGKPARATDLFVDRGPKERVNIFASSIPLLDKEGRMDAAIAIFEDRTSEYKVDRAKTEFVSIASHQLHTPLNAIRWFAETLREGHAGPLKPRQAGLVKEIETSNLRMIALVTSLLNVSRLETGTFAIHPKPVDLSEAVRDTLRTLTHEVKMKRLRVDARVSMADPYPADRNLLELILQNLLSNAVKYTPAGGSVSVRVRLAKKGDAAAGRSLVRPRLLVEVADTGCGIPKADRAKIFTKMFRAENARSVDTAGTGLGLYTVKAAVATAGGEVWFTSAENNGSTFVVALPPEGMREQAGTHELELVV